MTMMRSKSLEEKVLVRNERVNLHDVPRVASASVKYKHDSV
jgi:hypothetical protein